MKSKRRDFLKYSGLASLGMAGGFFKGFAEARPDHHLTQAMDLKEFTDDQLTMIGLYGPWAASITANKLPSYSFRNPNGQIRNPGAPKRDSA